MTHQSEASLRIGRAQKNWCDSLRPRRIPAHNMRSYSARLPKISRGTTLMVNSFIRDWIRALTNPLSMSGSY